MRNLIAILAASTALAGCATNPADSSAATCTSSGSPGARLQLPRRSRQSGRSASTLPAWTRSVAPGDDFYQFANGTWAKNTPDPVRQVELRHVSTSSHDISQQRVRDILDASNGRSSTARSAPPMRASSTRPRSRPRALHRSSPG